MANDVLKDAVQTAGDIDIKEVTIITSPSGTEYSLTTGYIGEINLFEDMYRGGLYGNILVIDANNLSQVIGLNGDEYLKLHLVTPSMDNYAIFKTFKVYSITDRIMISDTGKQSYIMHFCSPELFIDAMSPIYRTFKADKVTNVAQKIFDNFLATSRTGGNDYTQLIIAGPAQNEIQFTSPGWRPGKCLNWLASKALPQGYANPGYLFYESNKSFYFANVETLIDAGISGKKVYQEYFYTPNNLNKADSEVGEYVKDVDQDYKKVEDMRVVTAYNALRNTQTGYLANRLYTFDVVTKTHEVHDYDHVTAYGNFKHLEDIDGGSRPPFPLGESANGGALRSAAGYNQIYLKHKTLYTGVENNASDQIEKILPVRTSTMNELTNLKIELTVPGRTDIQVGVVVKFHYPDASPRDNADKLLGKDDTLYSGYYLVTAIRHKFTTLKHMMILELVKDSYKV